ncbi:protein of unknown function DUF1555 [Chthoniobacter flavus Ellin428]|uniref:Ice-binding protein C-terminal domain-containing protein n=1 Tax=Chthoniobacter flavus Ellin428 TaxID=497964 RepID=B4D6C2_9BACT|nr:PEP-CTERM sorting domain-containing protein [Chthoniobacter flavus]EDY18031.1 protein of unknown function DUF1555 [Chthoniobacter flavus Ellin428]TCO88273.1 putative secreted protein with PEP-CTERM sorting signal [Chthoniobacter flavus]
MKSLSAFYTALSLSWLLAASATASTLSGIVAGTSSSGALNANLTGTGGIDWALWNDMSSTAVSSFAPTNWKASDPLGLHSVNITPVSVVGQSTSNFVRGSSLTTATTFSYSDGSSPASASGTSGLVFNNDLNFSNVGVQLQVKGDPTQLLQLDIWAGGFAATGNLTLTLPNATPVTLTSQAYSSITPKDATLFTVFYQPDSASDLLTIAYTSTNTTTSGHVGIQAVSISAVPEPATGTLLIGALALGGFSRRRKAIGA